MLTQLVQNHNVHWRFIIFLGDEVKFQSPEELTNITQGHLKAMELCG